MTFLKEEPTKLKLLQEARDRVEKEWDYWMPIVTRHVSIPLSEYDRLGPRFLIELEAALRIKDERDRKKVDELKAKYNL